MKDTAITVGLDPDLPRQLDRVCLRSGRPGSEVVCEALRGQLELLELEQLCREIPPFAEARGYLTDEDIVRDVS